ncbi:MULTISPECIES: cytidylyltransferase domain-containing protein [Vibrio]|uniref:acylneuraminate cytidylyltransferase family protein n=1 Tax=Vibrio TaxID=662 RepID=UPI000315034B|nr:MULTISPECIES: acylneuraminate cytidylyltransferase family protein [Vibrio]OEE96931.1 HAD family hydrolase [Vibrio crassostreae 9ZC77]PMK13556.1 HAD family hydrolase [Vibrio sp. 10N.261.54.E10]
MSKVVAFVPVKLNNQRFQGKNIKKLDNGKPLISYILETLTKSACLDEIYVYCSSEEIIEYLPEGVHFLKRSESLDQDTTLINDVMSSFSRDVDSDIYVLAHATAPFIKRESIEKAVNAVATGEFDSALTVEEKNEFLWLDNRGPSNYDKKTIPRTQDLEAFYIETTGLYVYKKEVVQAERRIGDRPTLIPVDKIESIDINEEIDFIIANAISKVL